MNTHNLIAETKFCPYCGHEFVSAHSFCPYCGEDLPKQQPEQDSYKLKYGNIKSLTEARKELEFIKSWSGFRSMPNGKGIYGMFNSDTTYSERYSLIERQHSLMLIFIERDPHKENYKARLKAIQALLSFPYIRNDAEPLPLNLQFCACVYLTFLVLSHDILSEHSDTRIKFSEDIKILASDIIAFQKLCINKEELIKDDPCGDIYSFVLYYDPYEQEIEEIEDYASDIQKEIKDLENEINPHIPNLKRHTFNPDTNYWKELDGLIGLSMVKEQLRTEIENYKFQLKRKATNPNLNVSFSFHCIFKGKPGTGKTTVARLVAGILKEEGMIDKGCCVEVNAVELISGWIGFSAKNAKLAILKAMDGVLFIDEAYALMNSQGSESNAGNEVIDTLTPLMENYRGRIVVILAGYDEEMDCFLAQANTGFPSRFQSVIQFEDYNGQEMMEIFKLLTIKNGYQLDADASNRAGLLFNFIDKIKKDIPSFANARTVRNVFEKVEKRASQRMIKNNISGKDMNILTVEDVSLSKQELDMALGII